MNSNKVFIGIDGGRDTGVAVWSGNEFLELLTTDFWNTIDLIMRYDDEGYEVNIVIEDVSGNKPVFKAIPVYKATIGNHYSKLAAAAKVAQDIGRVKRETELIILFAVNPA